MPREDFENAVAAAKLSSSVEDRRRRRVAFEVAAKRMLRYIEDSEYLKVGVTELREQLEFSEEASVAAKRSLKFSGNEKKG